MQIITKDKIYNIREFTEIGLRDRRVDFQVSEEKTVSIPFATPENARKVFDAVALNTGASIIQVLEDKWARFDEATGQMVEEDIWIGTS